MKKDFLPIIKISHFIVFHLSFCLSQILFAQSPLHSFYYFSAQPDSLVNNSIQIKPRYILLSWHDNPIHLISTQIYGRNEYLFFSVEPTVVSEPYGSDILGVDYVRSGISGRITNAFIRYRHSMGEVTLGRTPVLWGQGRRSIISSQLAPNFDQLSIKMKFGLFQMKLLLGQLDSENLLGHRIKRHIAGHSLSWDSPSGKLSVSFGEQIIYTGVNRGIELTYLNPFVPYFFSALEGDVETNAEGDNDNSIIFATIRYVYKPNLSVFSELLIDDFQLDDNNYQDGLGYKIGADGAFDFSGKPITWTLEWTSINSWTYIHHGQFTSWQNRGHAIGFPYGPDLRSVYIQADMWLNKSISLNIEADWLEKGSNTLSTKWDNADNKDDPFPKPPVTRHTLLATSLSWSWKYGIVEAGWSNYPFPNRIAYSDPQSKEEGSLFLKAQFFYNFGFSL